MKRISFTLSLIAAAVIGASPVLAQTTSANTATKPLCSSLNNPNAGKLAGKDTGKAKEHSSSPVHQDCIPDGQAATAASGVTSGTTAQPSISPSTGSVTVNPPSVSSSSQSSVTGSTSTVSPNIDLRGRSSVTIDNSTSTGDQSLSSSTDATSSSNTTGTNTTSSTTTTTKKKPS